MKNLRKYHVNPYDPFLLCLTLEEFGNYELRFLCPFCIGNDLFSIVLIVVSPYSFFILSII